MQTMTDDIPAAAASATRALQLYRGLGDRAGQAAVLHMIGLHTATDDYPAAAADLRQALELFRSLGHRRGHGDALHYLGIAFLLGASDPAFAIRTGLHADRPIRYRPRSPNVNRTPAPDRRL
jgi:hypothetical protein